ncbi:MAG: tRNA pseudouridine(55) synthase TruB [Pseudomonadota bacterium]
MARRKKGRPVDGWIVIDKPKGVGSTQVVSKVRWAFHAQKAGHSGTLDPMATGALAVALGEATKTVPYAVDGEKAYRFTVRWGAATDTDDADGEAIASSDARPTTEAIDQALPAFVGEILQRPPAYSAIKVDGQRAYDLARDGEAPELAPRPIWVESLNRVGEPTADACEFEMVCGKGGYVRSVARDLGEALGCLGHVTALRRLRTGPFDLAHAFPFEKLDALREEVAAEMHLLPVSAGLDDIPALQLDPGRAAQVRQGRAVPAVGLTLTYGDLAWASCDGAPVAVGVVKAGDFHPSRVFNIAGDARV